MKDSKQVLSVRDRIQYRAFLLFYWQRSQRLCDDGTRNPDFISDVSVRLAAAVYASRDDLFEQAERNRPELIELYKILERAKNPMGAATVRAFCSD